MRSHKATRAWLLLAQIKIYFLVQKNPFWRPKIRRFGFVSEFICSATEDFGSWLPTSASSSSAIIGDAVDQIFRNCQHACAKSPSLLEKSSSHPKFLQTAQSIDWGCMNGKNSDAFSAENANRDCSSKSFRWVNGVLLRLKRWEKLSELI